MATGEGGEGRRPTVLMGEERENRGGGSDRRRERSLEAADGSEAMAAIENGEGEEVDDYIGDENGKKKEGAREVGSAGGEKTGREGRQGGGGRRRRKTREIEGSSGGIRKRRKEREVVDGCGSGHGRELARFGDGGQR